MAVYESYRPNPKPKGIRVGRWQMEQSKMLDLSGASLPAYSRSGIHGNLGNTWDSEVQRGYITGHWLENPLSGLRFQAQKGSATEPSYGWTNGGAEATGRYGMYYYENSGAIGTGYCSIGLPVGSFTNYGVSAVGITSSTRTATGPITDTLISSDFTLLCDCSLGAVTVNLPLASGNFSGRIYNVKKTDVTANLVVITPVPPNTIDGAAFKNIGVQYVSLQIQSDGTNWHII